MARAPLPVGSWGEVSVRRASTGAWAARARYRDTDGRTRLVERSGSSRGEARRRLLEALAVRAEALRGEVSRDSTVADAAAAWVDELVASDRAPSTVRRYRGIAERHVIPRLGELRLSEVTVGACERFVFAMLDEVSLSSARKARDVLSMVLGYAVRHGAMPTNPVRDIARLPSQKPVPRAVSLELLASIRTAVARWEAGMPVDGSVPDGPRRGRPPRRDLLDVLDVLLGTGARIGEVLALRWADVDLGATGVRRDLGDDRLRPGIPSDDRPAADDQDILVAPPAHPARVRDGDPAAEAGRRHAERARCGVPVIVWALA